jgi:hypothetical protein
MIETLNYIEGIPEGYKNGDRTYSSFFSQYDSCPFCHGNLSEVFSDGIIEYDPEEKDSTKDIHHSVTAKCCQCGWWTVQDKQTPDAHNLRSPIEWVFSWRGILRKFLLNVPVALMDSIHGAIAKHPEVINAISPRKMEEMVDAVVVDFFPGTKCTHCGKSNDGCRDLLLVIGDKPFALQVRHGRKNDEAESVLFVTKFIGAYVLKNMPNVTLFLTTTEDFTEGANASNNTILNREPIERFEQIARKPFIEMLEATNNNLKEPWRRCIPDILLNDHPSLTPYSLNLRPPN